ncbi:TIGR03085 family metal-binding protein [Nocardia africana]|uniref:Mycothiol maleylpyruvate isomerase N-terminal domain n=1 Tax=Nocardia africana TaxID=134964 RepID=A0A378X1B5_9NOCA|nr:Mycothiol maleylpyruvate isomerase N-terminal domain [Nocardia africana]
MSMAQRERRALVSTMTAAGPDAPTLCGTWTVRDLAAHLVVRERHPVAAPGILLKPLAGYLDSVQAKVSEKPFTELLEQIRTGPPWWSPLKPVDAVVNLTEMFVHHEDVRRADPEWTPRPCRPRTSASCGRRRGGWRGWRIANPRSPSCWRLRRANA